MILCLCFTPRPAQEYGRLLDVLGEFTPVVQALPPDVALADVTGSVRYFGRDAVALAGVIRMRALALLDVDATIGVAVNPLLARLAARRPASGAIRVVPDDVAAFLAGLPVVAFPGVGPATARTLASYGLSTAAEIAATPLPTLQRILGAAAGRRLHEHAHGIDPTRVAPDAPPATAAVEHGFSRDELDPVRQRDALTHLADRLGARLRLTGQTCRALTLTVRYAGGTATTRTRALPEPTAHTPRLRTTAHDLHTALGLQRARVRHLTLTAEALRPAASATRQLAFDPADDKAHRIEEAADRARRRFGPDAVRPASAVGATGVRTLRPAHPAHSDTRPRETLP
ncbi:hypothetical protein [Streptomyces sp. ST1020]|uniref:DNA polymerase Y family protein n=1 Tax=Streptomyces sp. ST1020 TaxID=1848901 RepID=UPI000DD5880A|nr:hypothetical protein [Streptomyces sp. ST1020]